MTPQKAMWLVGSFIAVCAAIMTLQGRVINAQGDNNLVPVTVIVKGQDATTTNNDPLPPGVLPPSKKQIRLEDAGNATFRAYAKVDLGEQAQLLLTPHPPALPPSPVCIHHLPAADSGSGGSGRRRLSEAQHALRRAILQVNNTRRSLQTCSYDKLRVYDNADNQVIGPIDVGACSGTTQYGDAFDFAASCSDPELDAMYDAVMRWVQANRPEWIASGYFDTFMMMPLPSCGSVFGQFKYGPRLITDEYADPVDPMGSAGPMTCYSAPNSFKAGWSAPIDDMGAKGVAMADLADGWNDYYVPAAAVSDKNLLRIILEQTGISEEAAAAGQERALFVSYRVAQPAPGFDSGIATRDGGHLMKAMLDVPLPPLTSDKAVQAPLPPGPRVPSATWAAQGTNWTYVSTSFEELGNLRIRVYSKNDTVAYVGLCRFKTNTEGEPGADSCYDTIDNDCDGLADDEDPDCNPPEVSPPPPPRKKPPPPAVKKPSGSSKGRRLA
eukprot:XP_001697681.1 predicted protein [Chlamydomonas reinhardtii]